MHVACFNNNLSNLHAPIFASSPPMLFCACCVPGSRVLIGQEHLLPLARLGTWLQVAAGVSCYAH
eukprot:2413127-Pleurochrysis_carterae.AAC.1